MLGACNIFIRGTLVLVVGYRRLSTAAVTAGNEDLQQPRANEGATFNIDILIQAHDLENAASFYVEQLGLAITDETPNLISLHGGHIHLFIERRPTVGPVHEVTVDSVEATKRRVVKNGCEIIKDEPDFPRDPAPPANQARL